ncbi:Ig-specific serine endopeptidase MIP [Mycoplasmopsis hyopharyngis]|uniref:Ig-specific serine endopeptidase MIP n=1 Tax=Mycoplasmopsis hyopharyngis TaxID=29558 RepID=UPI0038737F1A
MKKVKKILLPILGTSSIISSFLALTFAASAKCVPPKNITDPIKKDPINGEPVKPVVPIVPISDDDFKNLVSSTQNIETLAKLEFTGGLSHKKRSEILPTELHEKFLDSSSLIINKEHEGKISATIINVVLEKDEQTGMEPSNKKGECEITVLFENRSTKKTELKTFKVSGFKTNQGSHHSGKISYDPTAGLQSDWASYIKMSHEDRFKQDNSKYMSQLKNYLKDNASIEKARPELKDVSAEKRAEFDVKAKELGFDSYEDAALKGFTLPVYGTNGQVEGLKLNDRAEMGKRPSWVDSMGGLDVFKTNGLARTLPNETYRDVAEQTFQVQFTNKEDFSEYIQIAEKNIKIIEKWEEKDLQEHRDNLKKKEDEKLKYKLWDLQRELESSHESVKEAVQKRIEEAKAETERIKQEIQKKGKEDFIKYERDNIEAYRLKAAEGKTFNSVSGTMWIMDYIVKPGGATKFYFGTNSHVAKALKNNTDKFSILRMNQGVGVKSKFRLADLDNNFTRFNFSNSSAAITKVFDALDYMNTKPSDFLAGEQKTKYQDTEEFIDFAVIEIDFEQVDRSQLSVMSNGNAITSKYSGMSAEDLAKAITNNYETRTDKHIKFKSKSFLSDYNQIDRPLILGSKEDHDKIKAIDSLYILGYPSAAEDYFLKQYIDDDQRAVARNNFSLWINSDYRYYEQLSAQEGTPAESEEKKEQLARGNFLSYQIGYRSFTNKPGVTDGFLAAHRAGEKLYSSAEGKEYINFGLEYLARFYAPAGGSSGSSVRTKKNEVVGVVHVSNDTAKTSLIAALRSEGYNYQGLFGSYNLPQYDLIYGGGKEQKNSYRQEMAKKYNGQKSALFPSGFDEQHIPVEFKFSN